MCHFLAYTMQDFTSKNFRNMNFFRIDLKICLKVETLNFMYIIPCSCCNHGYHGSSKANRRMEYILEPSKGNREKGQQHDIRPADRTPSQAGSEVSQSQPFLCEF